MRRLVVLGLAFAAIGCKPPSDLDNPCRLEVPDPMNDGGYIVLKAGDPSIDTRFDFISTGNSDCENLVCIRMHDPADGFYDDSDGNAHGRCSNTCIPTSADGKSTDCSGSVSALVCQQLSFSQTFIDSFCQSDPADCSSVFGDNASATYCVDPTAVKSQ